MGRGEWDAVFWWRNMRERDHLKDTGIVGRIILKMDLQKVGFGGAWIGSLWLRIGTGSGHL